MPNVDTFITQKYSPTTIMPNDGPSHSELKGMDSAALRELSNDPATPQNKREALRSLADYMDKVAEKGGYYVTVEDVGLNYTDYRITHTLKLSTVADFALHVGKEAAQLQDQRFLAEYQAQVEQLQALKNLNAALEAVNTALAGDRKLSAETRALLTQLSEAKKITLDEAWKLDDMSAEQLETLRSNLTTAQSSQSATNEEASMRLNEAANARSAIFTQLHTLLQTLMQATQAVARW